MSDKYLGVAPKKVPKRVSRIVDESREMDFIREAIADKGLDAIWGELIAQFGALMYTRGRRSSLPSLRRVKLMSKKHDKLDRRAG